MKAFQFYTVFFFFLSAFLMAQDKNLIRKIDSLNLDVPYDQRIETSAFNLNKYLQNAKSAESIHYQKGIADSYNNISLIYYYQSKYDISTRYFFKAIKLYEALKLDGEAGNLYSLYGYRLRHKDIEKSMEYMQKGIFLAKKANAQLELMGMYDNYGLVKEANKEPDSAEFFFKKSLAMKKAANDQTGIPYSLNKLGTLYSGLGDFKKAKPYFDEAYALRLKLKDKVGIAENLSFYGTFYEMQGETSQAISYFKQALEASKDAGYRWLTHRIYEALSTNYEQSNQFAEALDYHKQFTAYKDSIYNLETTTNQKEIEIQFETEKKEKQILIQRAELAENKLSLERKNTWMILIIGLALLIGLIGYFVYRNQKLKNEQLRKENQLKDALIRIEAQNKVQEERLRISRDLHDNIGSQLTFIISSLDNLKFQLGKENPEAGKRIENINEFTRTTITELRDTIWAMNKENILFSDLKVRISNFLENAKSHVEHTDFEIEMNESIDENHSFSAFEGINLYRVIQEAVNNAIKHAEASHIKVSFEKIENHFEVKVSDNGKGIDNLTKDSGNGLNNMYKRITDLSGELIVKSEPGKGTVLRVVFS